MFVRGFLRLRTVLPFATLLLAAACAPGDDDDDDGAVPPGEADLRVAHVAPDAAMFDVFLDAETTPLFSDLGFGESTEFMAVSEGTHTIELATTGTAGEGVFDLGSVDLTEGLSYTVAAFGVPAELDRVLVEEDTTPASPGMIRIRAVHVANGVGAVDLTTAAPGAAPSSLVENLAYGTVSAPVELAASEYTLGLDADDDATPDLVFEIPALPATTVANVYAVAGTAGNVFLLVQTGPGMLLRIDPTASTPPPTEPAPTE